MIPKYWQKTQKPTQDLAHWITTPKQKETEREAGKPGRALQQFTEIRKLKACRLSFPCFNKKQGRIWRTTDTKAWYQFFCVFEKQLILWNHLKVRTSTCTKKGRSCLKNVLEFFNHFIDSVDKAGTMERVYCICISGKYLIFYYTGGRAAGREGRLQPDLPRRLAGSSGAGSTGCQGKETARGGGEVSAGRCWVSPVPRLFACCQSALRREGSGGRSLQHGWWKSWRRWVWRSAQEQHLHVA